MERLKNIVALLFGLFFAFFIVEIGLRIQERYTYGFQPYVIDKDGYALLKAHMDQKIYNREADKEIAIKTNSDGFRGATPTLEKSSSTLRIAFLGDSFTEGMQVDTENLFVTQLENYLRTSSTAGNIESINFGISQLGTADQILYYHRYVKQYRPDIVVLNVFLGNDLVDNQKYEPVRDMFLMKDISHIKPVRSLILNNTLKGMLIRRFATVRFALKIIKSNQALYALAARLGFIQPYTSPLTEAGIVQLTAWYGNSIDEPEGNTVAFTGELINMLSSFAKENGSTLVVGIIPDGNMVYLEDFNHLKNKFSTLNRVEVNHENFMREFRKYLDQDVKVIDSYNAMRRRKDQGKLYFGTVGEFGHFTSYGHKVYAEALYDGMMNASKERDYR